jgi:hypothetical protein
MVNILVGTLVSVADDVAQGDIIASALKSALASHETVCLSFKRVGSASSSFVSAALIPASRAMSFDEFKQARTHCRCILANHRHYKAASSTGACQRRLG